MDISARAPDDPVGRFFRMWAWVALVTSTLLFIAQFIGPLAATRIGPVQRFLFPVTMALYSVILIRGRDARGSRLLANAVGILMAMILVSVFIER